MRNERPESSAEEVKADLPKPNCRYGAGPYYAWAVELSTRPDYRSPAGRLIDARIEQIRGTGDWTGEDYRDLALTIIRCVSKVKEPFPRDIFRYAWGDGDGMDVRASLASGVAERIISKHPYGRVVRVANTAVERARLMCQFGKNIGLSQYAMALGIRRQSLNCCGYRELIAQCESVVQQALDRGDGLVKDNLLDCGVM